MRIGDRARVDRRKKETFVRTDLIAALGVFKYCDGEGGLLEVLPKRRSHDGDLDSRRFHPYCECALARPPL